MVDVELDGRRLFYGEVILGIKGEILLALSFFETFSTTKTHIFV